MLHSIFRIRRIIFLNGQVRDIVPTQECWQLITFIVDDGFVGV